MSCNLLLYCLLQSCFAKKVTSCCVESNLLLRRIPPFVAKKVILRLFIEEKVTFRC